MKLKHLTFQIPALPKISTIVFLLAASLYLLTACSKESSPPGSEKMDDSKSYAKADIHFITDNRTASFSAEGYGAVGAIVEEEEQMIMIFKDSDSPMLFFISLKHLEEGTYSHADGTLQGAGFFSEDSTDISRLYMMGIENMGEADESFIGPMEFTISSITDDFIKGSFSAKMVMTENIYEDDELVDTVVKEAEVTNGIFNFMRIMPNSIP